MNELKPCPFCGGEDIHIWQFAYGDFQAECDGCGAKSGNFLENEDAIKAWNRRVSNESKHK